MVENWLSSGVATADAIVSGSAPGRPALTTMVGKSTLGSSLTGSVEVAEHAEDHERRHQQRRHDRASDELARDVHGAVAARLRAGLHDGDRLARNDAQLPVGDRPCRPACTLPDHGDGRAVVEQHGDGPHLGVAVLVDDIDVAACRARRSPLRAAPRWRRSGCSAPPTTSTSWPGTRRMSSLAKVARSSIVPVVLLDRIADEIDRRRASVLPPAPCVSIVAVRLPLRRRSWMRGRSDCGRENETFTGCIWVMVTSGLGAVGERSDCPAGSGSVRSCRRSASGSANSSRLSRATSTAAWSDCTVAARALAVASPGRAAARRGILPCQSVS